MKFESWPLEQTKNRHFFDDARFFTVCSSSHLPTIALCAERTFTHLSKHTRSHRHTQIGLHLAWLILGTLCVHVTRGVNRRRRATRHHCVECVLLCPAFNRFFCFVPVCFGIKRNGQRTMSIIDQLAQNIYCLSTREKSSGKKVKVPASK